MVYFVSAKVDHFLESGLLFSMVAQERMGTDYTAKNSPSPPCGVWGKRIAHGKVRCTI